MQFTYTSLLAFLATGSLSLASSAGSDALTNTARATTGKIITVVVGSPTMEKSLVFTPSQITAEAGDMVQFQFSLMNHTVTQSTYDSPCQPIQATDATAAGIHSGFVPVTANETEVNTFTIPVNSTAPMYLYCAQGPHCQLGMVMTINAASNGTYSGYKALAAKAATNVPAAKVQGGVSGKIPSAQAVAPPV